MVSVEDAVALVTQLPEVTEGARHGNRTWFVRGKSFVWERPFSKADLKRFGTADVPDGPILAAMVDDLAEKDSVLASYPGSVFTIAHFAGYPAVLIHLNTVDKMVLQELITDAWLSAAPPSLASSFLGD